MTKGGWRAVSKEAPCHACGKPDWCSTSVDGKKAICRRKNNGSGLHKVDKAGQDYWLYELNGSRRSVASEDEVPEGSDTPEKADPETLDGVYRGLLDELSLSDVHRQNLHCRGLSEAEIKRGGYRTLPSTDREKLASALVECFGTEVCSMVSGLYRKETGGWSVAGTAGMLVPIRDLEERIVALKIRADDPGEGPKYAYLSSKKRGGPSPGAQVHVPVFECANRSVARLTEGELKADVATVLTGILTVSAPGVSSWRQALPVLTTMSMGTVRLAFDADAKDNEHVARALHGAYLALEEQGFEVVLETWPLEDGKGIDDLLAAGNEPQLFRGAEARAAVNTILAEATGILVTLKNVLTAKELLGKKFPDPKWIVPGIVPEGATILAGKPKMGKSWLALGLVVAVASGGVALGKERVEKGSAFYLALEDNPRRLQARLKKLLAGRAAPTRLEVATRWPRLGEGGLEALEAWLTSHPDARLIVIDTLAKFRDSGTTGKNIYKEDYEAVEPLVDLAARHSVAVLVVHHLRKLAAEDPLEQVSGSMGLTGGADGALVLNRERGRADAYLYVTGRDIEEEKELALNWDATTATWRIVGEAEEYRISTERQEIIECLRSIGKPVGPKDVSDALSKPYNNVKQLLFKMDKDGDVRNIGGGKYTLTDNFDNPDNLDEACPTPKGPEKPENIVAVRSPEEEATGEAVTEVIEVTERGGEGIDDDPALGRLLTAEGELGSVAEAIRSAEIIGVDLETTGLSPRTDNVRLISLSIGKDCWLVDC